MSYAQRKEMSTNRTAAIIIVALIHLGLGYALATGLAYNVIKQAAEDLKTFDVEDEPPPPPDEPPPPEPDVPPPPVVAPPPIVRTTPTISPPIITTPVAPPPVITVAPPRPAPPPPPPPPPPKRIEPARAKANLASYVSDDDYPQSAIRNEEQGVTGFRLDVGPDGRVTNCSVTSSSGSAALDSTTCRVLKSRARFTPATDDSGSRTSDSVNGRIRWQLPED